MRVVVTEFISLDGVVQAPGGPEEDTDGGFAHGGWSHPFFDPEVVGGAFAAGLEKAEALLYGRRTYLTMAAAWPERAGDPFADRLNSMKKYVVSDSLSEDELSWENTVRIPGAQALDKVRELRAAEGGDLAMMGSPTLVRALIAAGLVDELQLVVMPVLLGGGKSIFPADGGQRSWELVSSATAKTGAQVNVYRPAERS
ncbi:MULTISPECIES: dihydrofolate reductase family protein [Streptomyces]|uniref:Dihydrofolate reductase family protein n=1 Tax=Streptomyces flaveolus TaxID=67297 RepID=A0ABV3A6E1_9ACTN|nr:MULTISPECIES: dihydrofolate reductase family protein [Streptomyces]KMS90752.1 deaminase/reductase [Streptomyces regensis]KOG66881.1 deaminase/reductase [Streptomyces antibioticus]